MTIRASALLLLFLPACAPAAAPAAAASVPSATVLEVVPEALSAAAFKPFGEVIGIPEDHPPTLDTGAVRYWGGLAKDRFAEEVEFGMLTASGRPREVADLKRHARSPVLIVGLSGEWIIVVAPVIMASRPLVAGRVRAFTVTPGQAVLLRRGVWYADPFPKGGSGTFLVAFREGTARKDSKVRPFKGKEVVRIP